MGAKENAHDYTIDTMVCATRIKLTTFATEYVRCKRVSALSWNRARCSPGEDAHRTKHARAGMRVAISTRRGDTPLEQISVSITFLGGSI